MTVFPECCECDSAGVCDRTRRTMTPNMHAECQASRHYRYQLSTIPRSDWPDDVVVKSKNAKPAKPPRPPCIHLATRQLPPADPLGVACQCPAREVWNCEVHGRCTTGVKYPGVACCAPGQCSDYLSEAMADRFAILPPATDDPFAALRMPLPAGLPSDAEMRAGLEAVARHRSAMPGTMAGRGIVYAAGGPRFMCGVFVSVSMARWLGCDYPVEVWYNGDLADEYRETFAPVFRGLNVTFRDAAAELRRLGIVRRTRLDGWPLKPLAYLLSSFAEVLGLDADCYPVMDPRKLFDDPRYQARGAVLWPDKGDNQHGAPLHPGQWERFGLAPRQTPGIESGQVLIDKRRRWHALAVVAWLNDHHDYCYGPGPAGLYGDKDTFAIGFHAADEWGGSRSGTPYVQAPPTRWLHVAFMQHDLDRNVMFVHRCRDKPRDGTFDYGTRQRDPGNMIRCDHAGGKDPPIAHEWKVHKLVAEYTVRRIGAEESERRIQEIRRSVTRILDAPAPVADNPPSRAVVTMTSAPYAAGTWVLARMLRHVGCTLPLHIWYRAADPPSPIFERLEDVRLRCYDDLNPECGAAYRQHHRTDILIRGGVDQVLFLGSDVYPCDDPTPTLFDLNSHPAVLWWDHPDGDQFDPAVYGLPESVRSETWTPQGDTLLLDMVAASRAAAVAHWFNEREDWFFPSGNGDETSWRVALHLTGTRAHRYGDARVTMAHDRVLLHAGPSGRPMFVHRVHCKFAPAGTFDKPPMRFDDLPGEAPAWRYFDEWKRLNG